MNEENYNVLFDSAGRLLTAADKNQKNSEDVVNALKKVTVNLQNLPNEIRRDIDLSVENSLKNASNSVSQALVKRLEDLTKSVKSTTTELELTKSSIKKNFWIASTITVIVSVFLICATIYFLLHKDVNNLLTQRNNLLSDIRAIRNIDVQLCDDRPCVKIDKKVKDGGNNYYYLGIVQGKE